MTRTPRRDIIENALIIIILTFAPLALGSVHTWAYCTLAILALILFNVHFLGNTSNMHRTTSLYSALRSPHSLGALAFLVVALFYIVPLPPEAVKHISLKTWNLWQDYTVEAPSLLTLSLCVHATVLYIMKLITYLMMFLVIVSKCQSVKASKRGDGADCGLRSAERGDERKTQDAERHGARCVVSGTRYPGADRNGAFPEGILNTYVLLGALCAVLSILIHSLSDFNLHTPANALYFTVMLALVAGLSARPSADYGLRSAETNAPHCHPRESGDPGPGFPTRFALGNDSGDARRKTQDAGRQSVTSTPFVGFLTHAIILIGFIAAVFGILQKLSYNGKIYWLIKKGGDHFGPYINYDHYAGFMEMCAIFTIAVFIGNVASSSFAYTRRFVDKVVWFSTKEANKCLMYLFLAVVMATALFMTTSRGGIMSFIATCAALYFVCLISAESRKRKRMLLATLLVIVLIVVMFLWVGPEDTISRFKALQTMIKTFITENAILNEIRPMMWRDTLKMIKDFPVTGTGMGTYSYIFSKYRAFDASYGFLRFAHNDYLHFLAEMGAIGGVFLAGFGVWYLRKFRGCVRRLRRSTS